MTFSLRQVAEEAGAFGQATRHLIGQGCRRIAYFSRQLPSDQGREEATLEVRASSRRNIGP
jgi:DNA-binding LacI/PurR family transcriptional regulator